MTARRKVIAYRLTPIHEHHPDDPPMLVTAAVMTCMATGRMLDGMGGGGLFLSPAIVDTLRNDGRPKAVVLADEHVAMEAKLAQAKEKLALTNAALVEVMEWISNWSPNFTQDDEWLETKKRVEAVLE